MQPRLSELAGQAEAQGDARLSACFPPSSPPRRFVADCFDAAVRGAALAHRERRVACVAHLERITLLVREAVESPLGAGGSEPPWCSSSCSSSCSAFFG